MICYDYYYYFEIITFKILILLTVLIAIGHMIGVLSLCLIACRLSYLCYITQEHECHHPAPHNVIHLPFGHVVDLTAADLERRIKKKANMKATSQHPLSLPVLIRV